MVYILAFIGMICWGVSPIFAKLGLETVNPIVGLSIRTLFTASVILIWMVLSGSIKMLYHLPGRIVILLVIEAVLATLIGDLAYFGALKRGSASVVMLIMACSPLVTILCSVIFLDEKLTVTRLIGALLATVGIILIV